MSYPRFKKAGAISYLQDSQGSLITDGYTLNTNTFSEVAGNSDATLDLSIPAEQGHVIEYSMSCVVNPGTTQVQLQISILQNPGNFRFITDNVEFSGIMTIYDHSNQYEDLDDGMNGVSYFTVQSSDIGPNGTVTTRPWGAAASNDTNYLRANDYYPLCIALHNLGPAYD